MAASKTPTTRRASSTVEMNGINRRSKIRSGNWMSSALPMVSALMPVLSDRKKTGTTTEGAPSACSVATRPSLGSGTSDRCGEDEFAGGEGGSDPASQVGLLGDVRPEGTHGDPSFLGVLIATHIRCG